MNEIRSQASPDVAATSKVGVGDGDIHPARKGPKDFHPWLAKRWQDHIEQYGSPGRQGWQAGPAYPKSQPNASRRDSNPPEGGRPGSSLAFMQQQHLDANNIELGILNPLGSGQGVMNPELSAALCRATNEWQLAEWTSKDNRLRASVVVPYEDPVASAAEIRRYADNPAFVQVLLLSRTAEPMGSRKYWPIYEAAAEVGMPVGVHAFGYGGNPVTPAGWPSYYIEEMTGHSQCQQAGLTSLVVEGVFERWPGLKMVMIEAGFAWAPSLAWRLDKHWKTLRSETPHLKRLPSEYLRQQVWWTTQPMEEPDNRDNLLDTIEWMGWDRFIFATDYPHWDFDDPAHALPIKASEAQRRAFFMGNARQVYRGCAA